MEVPVEQNKSHVVEPVAENVPRKRNRKRNDYVLSQDDDILLAQLPPSYAEILRQSGSMKEIANRLAIPVGTVKSRTHRARAAFDELTARQTRTSH